MSMPDKDIRKQQVEELKKQEDVRQALEQTAKRETPAERVKLKAGHKFELGTYALLLIAAGLIFYLIRLGFLDFAERYIPLAERVSVGVMGILVIVLASKVIKLYLIVPLTNDVARFNLIRVVNFLVGASIFFIALSVLFASWYTAVVSFGLI